MRLAERGLRYGTMVSGDLAGGQARALRNDPALHFACKSFLTKCFSGCFSELTRFRMSATQRTRWTYAKVVDATGPAYMVRTYLEQADIRRFLTKVQGQTAISAACDIGAGYGRLSVVLSEFSGRVIAYERETHFVRDAQLLLPTVDFVQIDNLSELPSESHQFQFAMTFTVLQHLVEAELMDTVKEIKRIVAPGGFILLCEETDPSVRYGEYDSPEGGITLGRSIEKYTQLMNPFRLIETAPRRVEPGYCYGRSYMLFNAH